VFAFNPFGAVWGLGLAEDAAPEPISVPAMIRGIEGYGMIKHRMLWVAGLANGVGPTPTDETGRFDGNNAKDVYARFDYKIGGMGLDGDTGQRQVPSDNWRDNSLRVGVFTYRGDASHIPFAAPEERVAMNIEDRHFLRTGIYASWFLRDLNVFGTYLRGTDTLNLYGMRSGALLGTIEPDYHASFAQADYVIYPWLQATYRYETVTPGDREVASLRSNVVNVSALIRANIKAMVEYHRDLREGRNHSLNTLLRFAF
jgi:hypothetical protein